MIWHLLKHGTVTHDLHTSRDADGRMVEACTLCGYSRVVLGDEIIIGPAHSQKPDAGARTIRAIFDALTGIAYADDSQVVSVALTKQYGPSERVIVRLSKPEQLDKLHAEMSR